MCSACGDFADRWAAGKVNDSYGAIAQLVERFHGMEEVWSSILHSSTTQDRDQGPASGWSLAGFVAGEGCFSVTRKLPTYADGDPRLRFVFVVQVARRDRRLLEALQQTLACGSIHEKQPARAGWQPTSVFTVSGIRSHRERVIPFMDRHLLGGHKRHQFELWVRAMDAHELAHPTRWGKGPSTCNIAGCDRAVRGRGLCRSHYYRETGH